MKEQNKLIAEFMGYAITDSNGNHKEPENYKYHTSWDWLMPVVEKCVTLNSAYEIEGHEQVYNAVQDSLLTINIQEVHGSVIEFINWYNLTPKGIEFFKTY